MGKGSRVFVKKRRTKVISQYSNVHGQNKLRNIRGSTRHNSRFRELKLLAPVQCGLYIVEPTAYQLIFV